MLSSQAGTLSSTELPGVQLKKIKLGVSFPPVSPWLPWHLLALLFSGNFEIDHHNENDGHNENDDLLRHMLVQ